MRQKPETFGNFAFEGIMVGRRGGHDKRLQLVMAAVNLACPHWVARFKSNASWAWRLWLRAAQPARARRSVRAACSRGSSAVAVYCSAVASSR